MGCVESHEWMMYRNPHPRVGHCGEEGRCDYTQCGLGQEPTDGGWVEVGLLKLPCCQ